MGDIKNISVETTLTAAKKTVEKDIARLEVANRERGDGWRAIGLIGLFLEVRTMYIRLRGQLWERLLSKDDMLQATHPQHAVWKEKIEDMLRDLRNYAILSDLALQEEIFYPDPENKHWSEMLAEAFSALEECYVQEQKIHNEK